MTIFSRYRSSDYFENSEDVREYLKALLEDDVVNTAFISLLYKHLDD